MELKRIISRKFSWKSTIIEEYCKRYIYILIDMLKFIYNMLNRKLKEIWLIYEICLF